MNTIKMALYQDLIARASIARAETARQSLITEEDLPLYQQTPDETWTDQQLEAWSLSWPHYKHERELSYSDARRYYKATMARFGESGSWWYTPLMFILPICSSIFCSIIVHVALVNYGGLPWWITPSTFVAVAAMGWFVSQMIIKQHMWAGIFGKMTITYKPHHIDFLKKPAKAISYYPRLSRLSAPYAIHTPDENARGGVAFGNITVAVRLGETRDPQGNIIRNERDISWRDAIRMEAQPAGEAIRGFTGRVSSIIYALLVEVTQHGEIQSSLAKQVRGKLMEIVAWLPAIIIWGVIIIQSFSGYSLNDTLSETVGNLPTWIGDSVGGAINR